MSDSMPLKPGVVGDHPVPDVDPPTTQPLDAKKLNQKQSFIRHTPSAYNAFAYQPRVGKDLATLLVDESGMAPRFHLVDTEIFLGSVKGDAPTEDDIKKFKTPDIASKKTERELYPELVSGLARIVLEAISNLTRV